jgi:hypothetical protein
MALPYWSVRLASDDSENGLLSSDHGSPTGQGVRSVSLIGGVVDGEEPATITFELEAQDAQWARVLAQHRLGELRRRAGLDARRSPPLVVWVARLADEPESSLRFLHQAKDSLDEERFEMAVVAAQIHLEVQVRVLVEMTAEALSSSLLAAVISGQHRWAPHERWLQPILEALFSIKMAACPAWADYIDSHVPRRNAVVHRGQEIDAESAKASLDTVSAFWLWLNKAATAATGSV